MLVWTYGGFLHNLHSWTELIIIAASTDSYNNLLPFPSEEWRINWNVNLMYMPVLVCVYIKARVFVCVCVYFSLYVGVWVLVFEWEYPGWGGVSGISRINGKGVGVKKIMEKIHEIGKNMVGGVFFGRFGKIQHTFQGFFPGPPGRTFLFL